jgi:hypothetical protein
LAAGTARSSTNPTASILRSRWTPTVTSREDLHTGPHRNLRIQQVGGRRTAITINEFYASIQRQRLVEALGQKCGMDSPDAIAVDLPRERHDLSEHRSQGRAQDRPCRRV